MSDATEPVAIVTGASKGIGAAIAKRLAQDGFTVVVNYCTSEGAANRVASAIVDGGGRAVVIGADVSDAVAVAAMFDRCKAEVGPCSVLVNNAGLMRLKPIAQVEDADFDRMVATNLKGVFNCMREAARRLVDGGKIISLSSSANGAYLPGYGPYVATKAAVEGLTHVLAKELGQRRISVNVVAPGPTATELFLEGKSDEQVAAISRMIPFGRIGDVDEIANVVSFLAGEGGGWINGQVIRANGGMI